MKNDHSSKIPKCYTQSLTYTKITSSLTMSHIVHQHYNVASMPKRMSSEFIYSLICVGSVTFSSISYLHDVLYIFLVITIHLPKLLIKIFFFSRGIVLHVNLMTATLSSSFHMKILLLQNSIKYYQCICLLQETCCWTGLCSSVTTAKLLNNEFHISQRNKLERLGS